MDNIKLKTQSHQMGNHRLVNTSSWYIEDWMWDGIVLMEWDIFLNFDNKILTLDPKNV